MAPVRRTFLMSCGGLSQYTKLSLPTAPSAQIFASLNTWPNNTSQSVIRTCLILSIIPAYKWKGLIESFASWAEWQFESLIHNSLSCIPYPKPPLKSNLRSPCGGFLHLIIWGFLRVGALAPNMVVMSSTVCKIRRTTSSSVESLFPNTRLFLNR